jgi:ferrochelatase
MKTAVLLFNLGGPDGQAAVRPFLFNLFNDPAIIRLPGPLRWLLAQLISRRRAPVAQAIYRQLGGGSPLLPNSEAQARALEAVLGPEYRCFVVMRYWHPMADEQAQAVKAWGAEHIVAMPLYPQFSTTTTASSMRAWRQAAHAAGIAGLPLHEVCCWPDQTGLIDALVERLRDGLAQVPAGQAARVLFSAHGLPEKFVADGDPYQWQIERTVAAVISRLGQPVDHVICYQSRVGRLKWLEPSTETEVERAAHDKSAIVMVPVAFVSEHSETLVELDIEYGELAHRLGVPAYIRVPTVDVIASFIDGMAQTVAEATRWPVDEARSHCGTRICPMSFLACPSKEVSAP